MTQRLELMLAVRPNYHAPSLTAKALSTLDLIAPGRISLNVVSSWWADEARQYGMPFDVHDARYQRTEEWLTVLRRLLSEPTVDHHGALYDLEGAILEPKPSKAVDVYMGGESPRALGVIAEHGDAYVMHGDPPEVIADRVRRISELREQAGRPPLRFGVSGYVIVRDTEAEAQAELDRVLDVRSSPEAYASYQDFVQGSQLEAELSLRGVQRVQPRAAGRADRHAGAGRRPDPGVRAGRGRADAAAVQPAGRGDGAVRCAGHPAVPLTTLRA